MKPASAPALRERLRLALGGLRDLLLLLEELRLRRRKEISGDRHSLSIRRLLLRNGFTLDFWQRLELHRWLDRYPELRELYQTEEALHRFYRTRGFERATHAFRNLVDGFAPSALPEVQTLRRTLLRRRREVSAYFGSGMTNGRTEGFNLKAKLVKRRAFGNRSFRNYRLRLLNACAH